MKHLYKVAAYDLKVGMKIKSGKQKSWRSIEKVKIYYDDIAQNVNRSNVIIWVNEFPKSIILRGNDRVGLNIDVLEIADIFLADEKNDPRQKILKGVEYNYEPYKFYPCAHYDFKIRFDKWVFDIKEVRKFYGYPEKTVLDYRVDQFSFEKKIKEMLEMVGKPFPLVLNDLFFDKMYQDLESDEFYKVGFNNLYKDLKEKGAFNKKIN